VKYEWCDRPKQRSLKQLVVAARGRWRVAQDYQPLQEELGLDPFEGRSWTGCHQHVTMVLLAPLFLRLEPQRRASKRTLDAAPQPGVRSSACWPPGRVIVFIGGGGTEPLTT
jgi:SRSO17 transposase